MPSSPLTDVLFNKSLSVTAAIVQAMRPPYRVWTSHSDPASGQYAASQHQILEPKGLQGDAYAEWLLQACAERGIRFLVAGKERERLADWKARFAEQGLTVITAASRETQHHLEDKAAFLGGWNTDILPLPRWTVFRTLAEFESGVAELQAGAPGTRLCLKPARGIFASGFRILGGPDLRRFLAGDLYNMTYAAARELFGSAEQPFAPMLLMHTLEGAERSVDCVAWEGKLLAAVVRRKDGGLQEIEDRPDLLAAAQRLTETYQLSGIFNFQTKDDAAGRANMLEINARPSGGLRFSMAAGVNFGQMLLDAATGRPGESPEIRTGLQVMEDKVVRTATPTRAAGPGPTPPVTEVRLPSGTLTLTLEDSAWPLHELLDYAVRRNPKRGFLFVSRVLGKHIPTAPHRAAETHRRLAAALPPLTRPHFIGLAETATALGEGVFREWQAAHGGHFPDDHALPG
ncbi:phosphoribosyltransferase domain-containing protein [Deinococcus lacus]|uniref:Phosphoribosyltransferase domain-containing protein n=1 Tax=Deinococcus lacus TaxID=392561 RepID=A0ABW1YGU4_9DEIO